MWIGQFNALLVVAAVIFGAAAYFVGNFAVFFGGLIFLVLLRLGVGILNILSSAFRGKPLIYTVRIDHAAGKPTQMS